MPDYKIRDPQTGQILHVRGDSPPTEQELTELFSSQTPTSKVSKSEPGTYIGGVFKGLKEYASELPGRAVAAIPEFLHGATDVVNPVSYYEGGKGLVDTAGNLADIATNPPPMNLQTVKDVAGEFNPLDSNSALYQTITNPRFIGGALTAPVAAKVIPPAIQMGRKGISNLSRENVGGVVQRTGKLLKENPNPLTLPLKTAGKITEIVGEKIAGAPKGPNELPSGTGAERITPNVGGAVPVQGGVAPSISEEILNRKAAIRDAQSRQAMGEHPGAYGEGGLMPSGMEPTELRVGQPTDAELRASAARPRTAAPEGDIRPQEQIIEEIRNRTKQSPELRKTLDENLQRQSDTMHAELGNQSPREMGAARPISLKPEVMTPLQWRENLAMYGADKLSQLTGIPRAEVIQRAGSMAGHLPLEAETQMMDLGGPR